MVTTPESLASRRAHAARDSRLWRVEDALLETARKVREGELSGTPVAAVLLLVVDRPDGGGRAIERVIAGPESSLELVTHVLAVAQRDHLGG